MNILHKLGLYRASEVEELIAKTAALTDSVDGVIEEAKDTEECYKVVLAMYNEAQTPAHAVEVLKAHCGNQPSCIECEFNKGDCVLAHTAPCNWGVSND